MRKILKEISKKSTSDDVKNTATSICKFIPNIRYMDPMFIDDRPGWRFVSGGSPAYSRCPESLLKKVNK